MPCPLCQRTAGCGPAPGRALREITVGLFGVLRIDAYLPRLHLIRASGAAHQHSPLSWVTFLGADLTMAMWLPRGNSGRVDRAVLLNALNAVMCAAICALFACRAGGGPSDRNSRRR